MNFGGGVLDSQGETREEESSMEDEGNELAAAEISSAKDVHLEVRNTIDAPACFHCLILDACINSHTNI